MDSNSIVGVFIFLIVVYFAYNNSKDNKKQQETKYIADTKKSQDDEQKRKLEEEAKRVEMERIAEETKKNNEIEFKNVINTYKNYFEKFCELAEKEVSTLDEWGDENKDVLQKLKKECIIRVAKNVLKEYYEKDRTRTLNYIDNWFEDRYYGDEDVEDIHTSNAAPYWVKKLFVEYLPREFDYYHYHKTQRILSGETKTNINELDGIEFENYIAKILKANDYNVSGTPKTGDQGADLIATKNNKTYVIQAKRYSDLVGNKAVQEVVAAKNFYSGDIAAVVTNSSFTSSAKELAKKNGVILIDKKHIQNMEKFFT